MYTPRIQQNIWKPAAWTLTVASEFQDSGTKSALRSIIQNTGLGHRCTLMNAGAQDTCVRSQQHFCKRAYLQLSNKFQPEERGMPDMREMCSMQTHQLFDIGM